MDFNNNIKSNVPLSRNCFSFSHHKKEKIGFTSFNTRDWKTHYHMKSTGSEEYLLSLDSEQCTFFHTSLPTKLLTASYSFLQLFTASYSFSQLLTASYSLNPLLNVMPVSLMMAILYETGKIVCRLRLDHKFLRPQTWTFYVQDTRSLFFLDVIQSVFE